MLKKTIKKHEVLTGVFYLNKGNQTLFVIPGPVQFLVYGKTRILLLFNGVLLLLLLMHLQCCRASF